MKMFSECAGYCHMCFCGTGYCLAGHGDNDFRPATAAQLIARIQSKKYSKGEIKDMISLLKDEHQIIYDYQSKTVTVDVEITSPTFLPGINNIEFDIDSLRKQINDAAKSEE